MEYYSKVSFILQYGLLGELDLSAEQLTDLLYYYHAISHADDMTAELSEGIVEKINQAKI